MTINAWADLMPHQVTVEPYLSQDAYGAETYGAAVTYKARVGGRIRLIMDSKGMERTSMMTITLATTDVIDPRSRLTLPTGFVPSQPPILAVKPVADENGAHHVKLYT